MKKKILALGVCTAMLAIAIVGGTMAYFTDKDEKTNVFTVGNIDIELREWEKYVGDKSNENVKFSNIDGIMPGMTYNKIVNVKNEGNNDAYVQVTIVIPNNMTPVWNTETEWIGASTNPTGGSGIYVFTLNNPLGAGETTSAILKAVKLNADVTEKTAADKYEVIVTAEAIQAESFDKAEDAYSALATAIETVESVKVSNVDEMNVALQDTNNAGKVILMTGDVTSGKDIVMGENTTLDGDGHTLEKTSDVDTTNNAGITTVGGKITDITVLGTSIDGKGFRAVYATSGIKNDLVIDGATLSGTYALNISGASPDHSLIVKNSTLNGWTSYAPLASAKFDNVKFGDAVGYHNLKPQADTILNDCEFNSTVINEETKKFMIDAGAKVTITFNNCKVDNTQLTAANFGTLFQVEQEITTFGCTVVVDGVTVAFN